MADDDDEDGEQPARKRVRVDDNIEDEDEDSRYDAVELGKKGGNAESPIMISDERDEGEEINDRRSRSESPENQEQDGGDGSMDPEDDDTPTDEFPKGVTRPPRFIQLGIVDGVITVLDDPFSEEESEEEESEEENERDPNAEVDPADKLVKPASKKRLRQLQEAKQDVGDSNEKVATFEELVEMRGDGRYFGKLENEQVLLCINCHQPGHMASDCQVIVCQTCGEQDDHLTRNCPKTKRCSNCNKLGHDSFACKERRRDIYCSRCRSSRHGYETCPSIWCLYTTSRKPLRPISALFCYNCAEEGHYGDNCPRARPMMQPLIEASVFSAPNLPSGYKLSKELESIVAKRGGFGTPGRSSNVDSYRPSLEESYRNDRNSYRPDHRHGDRGRQNRPARDRDRDYPPPRDDYFDRGRKSHGNGQHSRKDPIVDKRVDSRYSDADRDDWSRRRQQDSDSRYDYPRGSEPKVSGAISLQGKSKKEKSGSVSGGMKQKISAGKEAFKKLMR
ncbi:hypothetical protein POJ06DRAFT_54405 [Lipomyces tetrasporus]|uniref:CCHC-type domain-containing protein n=1 Tax=Lipomyces tetrasporus TaxID=54092 RepID=A0AAD7QWG0_9ASCO|nr:uncharacterized protein POJ06DRAFT_54405 [Lipomyces tetrasporus]KAJ8102719.1 hypothetical protein POJ06DRAFT_54405 [Lipomyces tetrasporus]